MISELPPEDTIPNTGNLLVSQRYIVGIAASAGGLEALRLFVGKLKKTGYISYVVAQHLSPQHKSMMVDLLARETELTVMEAKHDAELEPDFIYIGPPNSDVFVTPKSLLGLREPLSQIGPKPSADYLFASIAAAAGERAIGIVMSGTGNDGAHGIIAIKAAGGICIAQSPDSAKYDSMPAAAIKAGVDLVMDPTEIALSLLDIVSSPRANLVSLNSSPKDPASPLGLILRSIYQKIRIDFSEYKESTIIRQIERRMAAQRIQSLEDYLAFATAREGELEQLATSFMICVTSFFRDGQVFDAFGGYIKKMLDRKAPGDEIRIWVPGCATGEEAYSIAILLAEELGDEFNNYKIQIFATDVNNVATDFARKGIYPESTIEKMPKKLLHKYFTPVERKYQVNRSVRDVVLFATHDLTQDPPFVRLDLVSCRNLLIYLKPGLQEKILQIFHYSLISGGVLFLGKSESLGAAEQLYDELDKKAHIYRKRVSNNPIGFNLPRGRTSLLGIPRLQKTAHTAETEVNSSDVAKSALFEAYTPPSARINESGQILELYGDTSPYLKIKSGMADFSIFSIIPGKLRTELKAIVQKASRSKEPASTHAARLEDAADSAIRIIVRPIMTGYKTEFLVSFENARLSRQSNSVDEIETSTDAERTLELQHELALTKESLQTVIEELETSNEELQALNEEAQASNEELQATNEELQTANEELQATNEELTTINDELTVKGHELSVAMTDMATLETTLELATIQLDKDMRCRRMNERASRFFAAPRRANGFGDPLFADMGPKFRSTHLVECIERVSALNQPMNTEFFLDDAYYEVRVIPFSGSPDKGPADVTIIITDSTRTRTLYQKLYESEKQSAIGMLTGGLAHDFNNLLNIIISNLELIRLETKDASEELKESLEAAIDASVRGGKVTRSLLSVAGRGVVEINNVDLNETVVGSLPLIKTSLGPKLKLVTSFCDEPLPVAMDLSSFTNSLLNLTINAKSASEASKDYRSSYEIYIRTFKAHLNHDLVHSSAIVPAGEYAVIEVIDNGIGMSPQIVERATQPFFTTKQRGEGTGLGLSMVSGFIKQLSGGMVIRSRENEGTTIALYIPLQDKAAKEYQAYEDARLKAVAACGLDDGVDYISRLENILDVLKKACAVKYAALFRVDAVNTVKIAGTDYLSEKVIPRLESFSAHTIKSNTAYLEVSNAMLDSRFNGKEIVRKGGINFYAGAPIFYKKFAVAALSLMDDAVQVLSVKQVALVQKSAKIISDWLDSGHDMTILERGLAELTDEASSIKSAVDAGLSTEDSVKHQSRKGATAKAKRKILVVDDEQSIVRAAVKFFNSMGYEVETAYSAEEALTKLENEAVGYIFSDIRMPGAMSGLEMADVIREKYPETKVVLTSGYSNELVNRETLPYDFVPKPYRLDDLKGIFGKVSD